jgi:hypothetical protein
MRSEQNERCLTLHLEQGLGAEEALEIARELGAVPVGSNQSGCYQIQGPTGFWEHKKANKIDFSTPRKAANVLYTTWEQWDDE